VTAPGRGRAAARAAVSGQRLGLPADEAGREHGPTAFCACRAVRSLSLTAPSLPTAAALKARELGLGARQADPATG
jgi:hypothetical protein